MIKKLIKAFERAKYVSENGGEVIIFGAGSNGKIICDELTRLEINVSRFLDNDCDKQGCIYCGLNVGSLEDLTELKRKLFFICSSIQDDSSYNAIRSALERQGLKEGEDFGDFGVDGDRRFYSDGIPLMDVPVRTYDLRYKLLNHAFENYPGGKMPYIDAKTIVIPGIDLKITNVCNLKCPHCAHAIPQLLENRKHFSLQECVDDLDRLLEVSFTPYVCLIGGEPFLHPQFPDVIGHLKKMKNIGHSAAFHIITNGTIVPNDEMFAAFAELPNSWMRINDHSNHPEKAQAIIGKCKANGISFEIPGQGRGAWSDFGDIRQKRNRTSAELRHLYAVCESYGALYDGKFYKCYNCPTFADAGMPSDPEDYIDIRNSVISKEELKEKLWQYLYVKPYLSACDYCDGNYHGAKEVSPGNY